ncbi:MAG: amidohydrolase family protein, partial [Rhodospirillaceae bacterium]|nr:amidohydrolase family protein [Rhodospirillaceae bacterium]
MQLRLKIHALLALCLLLPGLGSGQAPDRILYNGKVLTVDRDFSVASSIAIRGERILAVGETDEVRPLAGEDTEEIDLEGRTVIPGLIDNHIHYLRATNFAAYETRIHGVTSRREVMARISSRAKELGPGRWIFILGGWSEQQFADEPGGFTREELDEAAPDNPVFIQRTYSTFYMNSLAVDQIAPAIPELYEGGSIVRTNSQDGRTVMYAALEHFPFAETLGGRMDEVRAFNDYLTSMGVTTVYDAGYLDGSYDPVEALHEAGELSLRVFYAARYWADSPRTAIAA